MFEKKKHTPLSPDKKRACRPATNLRRTSGLRPAWDRHTETSCMSRPVSRTLSEKQVGSQLADQREKQNHEDEYFFFDLSDESHEKLLDKELREAKENPLGPLEEVTKVEY
jgi:hypothetical protein